MRKLNEVIRAKMEKDIEQREEIKAQEEAEAARIREAEAMAAEDAIIVIQRESGFTLDGWTLKATHSSSSETEDYFTISLTCPSDYENFPHRVSFGNSQKVSYFVVDKAGLCRFATDYGMTTFRTMNSAGQAQSKVFDRLLDALIFAKYGSIGPEAILASLNGEGL